jgi:glucosamine-6-phosphate deaminase
MDYETKIREMGGIGFFLGGIGPDGHIAFNVRGSSTYSVTRLTGTNYETQAGASADLGGIEISRNRLVITIGLGTITYNPTTTAIIIAAGDAKAPVVASAIQEQKAPLYPASVLQDLPHARFYLTKGAASRLVERRAEDFSANPAPGDCDVDEITFQLALENSRALTDLTRSDFEKDRFGRELLKKTGISHSGLAEASWNRMIKKIERGLAPIAGTTFLHTEPHHDDTGCSRHAISIRRTSRTGWKTSTSSWTASRRTARRRRTRPKHGDCCGACLKSTGPLICVRPGSASRGCMTTS